MSNSWDKYDFDAAEQTWFTILRAAIPSSSIQGLRSRSVKTNETPRFEVYLQTQPQSTHKHILDAIKAVQFQPSDVWSYQLTFAVSTNRESNGDQHAEIVARGREALQFYKLAQSWDNTVFTITDSYEQPLVKSVDDALNIDTSTLTFTGMLCIRAGAWN